MPISPRPRRGRFTNQSIKINFRSQCDTNITTSMTRFMMQSTKTKFRCQYYHVQDEADSQCINTLPVFMIFCCRRPLVAGCFCDYSPCLQYHKHFANEDILLSVPSCCWQLGNSYVTNKVARPVEVSSVWRSGSVRFFSILGWNWNCNRLNYIQKLNITEPDRT
jgi:hypothetical protein